MFALFSCGMIKKTIFVIFHLLLNVVHEGGLAADRAGVDEAGNKRPHKK
jgi:hypothetical protein